MKSDTTSFEKSYSIKVDNEDLIFDFRRAIFWPVKKILILADLHIGKTGHFRKNGIAISNSVAHDDFKRLDVLINTYAPEEILILGDLSHSRMNKDWDHWLDFLQTHSELQVSLVPGNHDILPKIAYENAEIQLLEPIHIIEPFAFIHESQVKKDLSFRQISGHVHPGIRLNGAARQGMTLPCFHISDSTIILPAFSGFTGRFKIKAKKNDKILAVTHKSLFLIVK